MAERKRRAFWIILSVCAISVATILAINWNRLPEYYYAWQLSRAEGEEAWDIAAKLDGMGSERSLDWYVDKLKKDVSWENRVRAASTLGKNRPGERIEELIQLAPPPPPSEADMTRVNAMVMVNTVLTNSSEASHVDDLIALFKQRALERGIELPIGASRRSAPELSLKGTEIEHRELGHQIQALEVSIKALAAGSDAVRKKVESLSEDGSATEDFRRAARVIHRCLLTPPQLQILEHTHFLREIRKYSDVVKL